VFILYSCKPVAYLSFHNQHKYYQSAKKYKLLVKLPFGIVSGMVHTRGESPQGGLGDM